MLMLIVFMAMPSSVSFADPELENQMVNGYWYSALGGPGTRIDLNQDQEISAAEALAVAGYLIISPGEISSLIGLDAFVNTVHLFVYENNLDNLAGIPQGIETLFVDRNEVSAVDLSSCPNLRWVELPNNRLTTLPALPAGVEFVDVSRNQIVSAPDLSALTSLVEFRIDHNRLISLPLLPSGIQVVQASHNSMIDISNAVISNFGFNPADHLDVSMNALEEPTACFNLTALDLRFTNSGATLIANPQQDISLLEAELEAWPIPFNITVFADRLNDDVYASPVCE